MIRLLVLDVDGTLTDGSILLDDKGREIKKFDAHDGLILRVLPDLGISTALITGRTSEAVTVRARDLRIACVRQGVDDKRQELLDIMHLLEIDPAETAYIGDDLNDLSAMLLCGYRACPADASTEIRAICDYISNHNGGRGAVRDIVAHWLQIEGAYEGFMAHFGVQAARNGVSS